MIIKCDRCGKYDNGVRRTCLSFLDCPEVFVQIEPHDAHSLKLKMNVCEICHSELRDIITAWSYRKTEYTYIVRRDIK